MKILLPDIETDVIIGVSKYWGYYMLWQMILDINMIEGDSIFESKDK